MSRHRRAALVAAVLVATGIVSGCGAGYNSVLAQPYAPADGVMGTKADISVHNVLVVAAPSGSEGVLVMSVSNRAGQDDQLTGIQVGGGGTVTFAGSRTIPARGTVDLTGSGAGPSATIRGLTAKPGQEIDLLLTFARAGELTLRTVVLPATREYSSLTPAPQPTAAATPTRAVSPAQTNSPAAGVQSPGPSPSPS